MMKSLNEPIYKVIESGRLAKYFQLRSECQKAVDTATEKISIIFGINSKDIAIFSNGEVGIVQNSPASKKLNNELKVAQKGYRKLKKRSLFANEPRVLEAVEFFKNAERQVNPFTPHDVLGINNVAYSQKLNGSIFLEVSNEKAIPKESLNAEIKKVQYSDYLDTLKKVVKDKEELE